MKEHWVSVTLDHLFLFGLQHSSDFEGLVRFVVISTLIFSSPTVQPQIFMIRSPTLFTQRTRLSNQTTCWVAVLHTYNATTPCKVQVCIAKGSQSRGL